MSLSLSFGAWLPLLRRLPGNPRAVALTIDDSPSSSTPALLDLLRAYGATASFFVSGARAENRPDLVEAIHRAGHAVFAHGWEHVRLDREPEPRLIADMERCEALLARFRPTPRPYFIRLPYNGGYRNASVHRRLAAWMPDAWLAHWELSTEDHLIAPRCAGPESVALECAKEVDRLMADPRLAGAIVLMHDEPINQRPGEEWKPKVTIALLELLLKGIAARGLAAAPLTAPAHRSFLSRFVMA